MILSGKGAVRTGSSELLKSALVSAGLASTCSTRYLTR